MLGSTLKKALCSSAAVALITAAGMAVSKDAEATAFAYSSLTVSNMLVSTRDSSGTVRAGAGLGFDTFEFISRNITVNLKNDSQTTESEHTGDIVGTEFRQSGNVDIVVGAVAVGQAQTVNSDLGGSNMDLQQLCLGDCTTAPASATNDYSAPAFDPLRSYAVGDSHMTDTVLAGPGLGSDFGVQAGASAEAGQITASGNTVVDNRMNWNFVAGPDDVALILVWDEIRNLFVQKQEEAEAASATLNFTITLTNEDTGFSEEIFSMDDLLDPGQTLNPNLVQDGSLLALNTFGPDETQIGVSATGGLVANDSYNLVFSFDASAEASSPSVPEPGAIALLGAGLLGLGLARARRRKKVNA